MTVQRIKAKSVKVALEQVQKEPSSLDVASDKKQGRKALLTHTHQRF